MYLVVEVYRMMIKCHSLVRSSSGNVLSIRVKPNHFFTKILDGGTNQIYIFIDNKETVMRFAKDFEVNSGILSVMLV